jgi:MFS superfamily sulfate permease-like transporter
LTFINELAHEENIKKLSGKPKVVILDLRYLFYIDIDGMNALKQLVNTLDQNESQTLICGVNDFLKPLFLKAEWFQKKQTNEGVFDSYQKALYASFKLS